MEARSRRVGGGFPGYNGPALPRAMRSSRGRGESSRRTAGYGGRSGFFELLATVAGQILQEDSIGEEQEVLKLTERASLKQKCSEPLDMHTPKFQDGEVLGEKLQRESSSALVSCLESLGEAIRSDEEKKLLLEENKNENIGADSVHSVVSKAFLSRPPADERRKSLLENLKSFNMERRGEKIIKVRENDKQMTSSVSDNDENQTKSDPESSISTAIKFSNEIRNSKLWVDSTETIESLQTPKTEESGHDDKDHDDDKGVISGIGGNGLSSDMEIDLPHTAIGKHDLDCDAPHHISSIVTDMTKAEVSSGEVTHLHGDLRDDVDLIMDLVGTKKFTVNKLGCENDAKPWKNTEFYGKDDDGESGLEVDDDKSTCDAKKLLKVTDVILGKLEPKEAGDELVFLSELILGNARERISSKDGNCASSKQVLPDEVAKKLKDSYAKGMRARKVVKMVKRGRVSSCRQKRKHNDMNGNTDLDEGLVKKSYYSGLSYTRQRTSRGFPAKRKKMADGSPMASPDLRVNTSNLMDTGFECAEGEPPAAAAKLRSAKAASVASSPKGCSTKMCKKAGESHVKFTIKSFTVPELSVDLPESATVSSLKRAVMDAAMNLLGGGLRVRVLLQGKKVPDEGATLAQVGISRTAKPDSLGFMLEPSPLPTSPTSTSEDPLLVLSRAAGQPSPRYPVFGASGSASGGDLSSCRPKSRTNKSNGSTDGEAYGTTVSGDQMEGKRGGLAFPVSQEDGTKGCTGSKPKGSSNDRMPISSHSTRVAAAGALAAIRAQVDSSRRSSKNESEPAAPIAHESMLSGSGAIILHPSMNAGENIQGLALVPIRQKPHSLDVGKRRVRRPFSVAEVEALVHAVEKLGTGRWRDVKLRAFDQAKHRTYVDLKDKWKTLVHTARIAPHQRRGEPVPQELLERVTRAHTYWTAQAAKQQAELDY